MYERDVAATGFKYIADRLDRCIEAWFKIQTRKLEFEKEKFEFEKEKFEFEKNKTK